MFSCLRSLLFSLMYFFDLFADFTDSIFVVLSACFPFVYEGPNSFVFFVHFRHFWCCCPFRCCRVSSHAAFLSSCRCWCCWCICRSLPFLSLLLFSRRFVAALRFSLFSSLFFFLLFRCCGAFRCCCLSFFEDFLPCCRCFRCICCSTPFIFICFRLLRCCCCIHIFSPHSSDSLVVCLEFTALTLCSRSRYFCCFSSSHFSLFCSFGGALVFRGLPFSLSFEISNLAVTHLWSLPMWIVSHASASLLHL